MSVDLTNVPRVVLTTPEQINNWVLELVAEMEQWRKECSIVFPDSMVKTVDYQRRAMWTFLTKQGQVVGALKTLLLCGLISDRVFSEFMQKAIDSLIPKKVGG